MVVLRRGCYASRQFRRAHLSRVERLLCDDQRFASLIPGFAPRAPQLAMAKAVEAALAEQSVLVVEAETGTGKTLAYLVPALLADGPTIISTDRKSTRLNSSHVRISYAVFCLKKKKKIIQSRM